jgi:hypothetical protein
MRSFKRFSRHITTIPGFTGVIQFILFVHAFDNSQARLITAKHKKLYKKKEHNTQITLNIKK